MHRNLNTAPMRDDEGAPAVMSDTAEFEHLKALELRLSQALDRIEAGVAASKNAPADDGAAQAASQAAESEAARQDAEARATEATDRVSALEERLAETQDALAEAQSDVTSARAEAEAARAEAETAIAHAAQTPGSDAATLAAMEEKLAAAEASRGAAQAELDARTAELEARSAELAEKDVALADLQAALEAAQQAQPEAADDGGAEPEDMEKALAVLGRRAERAREERDAARTACDAATDALEELQEATGTSVDDRILELRRQLRLMRTRAEDLAAQVSLLQSGADVDSATLNQGLLAEVETLRQLRETDAAELDRIIQDMQAGLDRAEGGEDA